MFGDCLEAPPQLLVMLERAMMTVEVNVLIARFGPGKCW